ncbi:MAG: DNA-binding protein, partial [Gammaproteobacteria bacterium]
MPKKIISKQEIIDAAKILAASDRNPTLAAVRKQLNYHGSNSTIHRYLKEWKKSCLGQSNINTTLNLNNQTNIEELIEKQYDLEKNLQQQITQNEHYTQELINAEKTNIVLKEENHQLQITNQELQLRLTAADAANNVLRNTTQEIKNSLDANNNKTVQKMQHTIDDLRIELKTLNETSIAALRDTSNKGHEALMQEKVTSINLQAK